MMIDDRYFFCEIFFSNLENKEFYNEFRTIWIFSECENKKYSDMLNMKALVGIWIFGEKKNKKKKGLRIRLTINNCYIETSAWGRIIDYVKNSFLLHSIWLFLTISNPIFSLCKSTLSLKILLLSLAFQTKKNSKIVFISLFSFL